MATLGEMREECIALGETSFLWGDAWWFWSHNYKDHRGPYCCESEAREQRLQYLFDIADWPKCTKCGGNHAPRRCSALIQAS
jgi:hypothetical protein